MKKLLEEDYDQVIKEALCLREADLQSYYFGIAEEYASSNSNLFEGLERAVKRRSSWFVDQITRNMLPAWEVYDEKPINSVERTGWPMIHEFGVNGHLYKADIEKQLEYIKLPKSAVELVQATEKLERMLTVERRERLLKFPRPSSLNDFDGWKDRGKLVLKFLEEQEVSTTSKESQQEAVEPINLPEDQKKYLHEVLLDKYLYRDTTYEQWCRVLAGDSSNPILWVDFYQGQSVRVSTIGYLFYALHKKGYISKEQRDGFVDKASTLFMKYDHRVPEPINKKSITNQVPPKESESPYKAILKIIDAMPK